MSVELGVERLWVGKVRDMPVLSFTLSHCSDPWTELTTIPGHWVINTCDKHLVAFSDIPPELKYVKVSE